MALKRGQPIAPFEAVAREAAGSEADAMLNLLTDTTWKEQPAGFEERVGDLPLWLQAQAYVVATVVLGAEAPPAFRTFARAALFASERPYLGAP